MKYFKRAIATVLVLAMVLTLAPAVFAVGGFTVDISDASLAKGEKVVLAVKISGHDNDNPVAAAKLAVEYDKENLKLTKSSSRYRDFDSSSREQSAMSITANGDAISWADAYGLYAEDGDTLFWMEFTTQNEVVNGSYPITFKAHNSETMFSDGNRNLIPDDFVTINVGTITVTGGVDKLNDSNTTFENLEESYVYNDGNPVEPAFTVQYDGKTLTKDTDYTVSYENNTKIGTATITVTGIGSYRGTASKTFEIVKKTGKITGTETHAVTYGDVFPLEVAVNSGAALSYTSSNPDVATVDAAGNVTAVGAGSANITVSADETEYYTKPGDFTVNVTVGKASQNLTVQEPGPKTYGDADFNLSVSGNQGPLSYSSSKPTVASVDENGKVTIEAVGTTTITVTAAEVAGKYDAATKSVTVTVAQKEVSVSGITVEDKVYDKTTDATVTSKGVISGMVEGDDLDVNVTGAFENETAGENKTVNLTVELIGSDVANYKLASDSQTTASATIEKAPIAVPTAKTGLVYNAKEQIGVEAADGYTVSGGSATNAGGYIATATLNDATNYKWADASFSGSVAWSIAKDTAESLAMEKSLRYNTTDVQTITVSEIAALLNKPGDVTIADCTFGGDAVLGTQSYTADAITYALTDGLTSAAAGKQAVMTATIASDNYEDLTLTITVKVQDKEKAEIVFVGGSAVYNGKVQKHETATFNGSANGITYTYSADPINVGTYQVTAIYEDVEYYGKETVSFRIDPASVSVAGAVVAPKEYDGTTDAVLSQVNFSGLVNGESFSAADYTVTSASFADVNVGEGKPVSYTVELNATSVASNYELTGTAPAATGKIEPKKIAVTLDAIADQVFSGNPITPAVTVSSTETIDGYALDLNKDYSVSYSNNVHVGTAVVEVESKAGSNYTFDKQTVNFEITQADAPTIADLAAEYTYNYAGTGSLVIEGIPENAGEVTYEVGAADGEVVFDVSVVDGKVNITVKSVDASVVGKEVKIPVTVKMQNYAEVTFYVVVARSEKEQPTLAVQPIEKTYDGVKLTASDIRGTATFEGQVLTGTWSWVTDPTAMVNANEAGYTAKVKFTPDDFDTYAEVEAEITVVINKADPTGAPGYAKIEDDGLTLADALLNVGTIAPDGTIGWVKADTTVVEQGVAYQWIFIPNDTVNYNRLTGEITPYAKNNNWGVMVPVFGGAGGMNGFGGIIDRFYDVHYGDWYADAVEMVVSQGLFEGVSYNEFNPNGTMTRAMLVTVLWRLAGQPVPYAGSSFSDVPSYEWYADAVAWAQQSGIVDGVSETSFAPNQSITREQMAVILHRYAKSLGYSGAQSADLFWYADGAKVSSYAQDAMSWAVAKGLISGMTESTLAPQGTATRAQVATILMRFVNYVL